MDLEKTYKYCNYLAVVVASFTAGTWWAGTPWWIPALMLITPTTIFLVVILLSLAWSFYLTKDWDDDE